MEGLPAARGVSAGVGRTAAVDARYHASVMRHGARAVAAENDRLRVEKQQRELLEQKERYLMARREGEELAAQLAHNEQHQKHQQARQQEQYREVLRDQIEARQRANQVWEGMSTAERGMNKGGLAAAKYPPAMLKKGVNNSKPTVAPGKQRRV